MGRKFKRLWALMEGRRRQYLASLLALFVAVGMGFAVPLVGSVGLDLLSRPAAELGHVAGWLDGTSAWELPGGHLPATAGLMVLLAGLGGLFNYWRGAWSARACETIACNIRTGLYGHIGRLPCSYHDQADRGDLLQRCSSDVETVRLFLADQVLLIGRCLLMLGIGIPIMLSVQPWMTAIALATLPILVVFGVVFFRAVQRRFLEADQAEGRMTEVINENLNGIRVVRAFARQGYEIEKFDRANHDYRDRSERVVRSMAWYWSLSDLLCVGQLATVIAVGSYGVLSGWLSAGELYLFIACVSQYLWPMRQSGRVLSETGKALVALGRIDEILAEAEEAAPEAAVDLPAPARGEIELRNVHFAYRAGRNVLHGLNLHIQPGETVALLGPSGCGKSTIISLLLRFYDGYTGSILLDGRELSRIPRELVREQFAVVMQEPFLYARSIAANILQARSSADQRELEDAARIACVHETIAGFSAGYQTVVGERGVTLSGGQRQRVAIARAILREAPILVLDDALSAVDTHTEQLILQALRARRGRQTTILIAHRLSTLMLADRIAVVQEGRITQLGTHGQLAAQPGLYRQLWQIQNDLLDELDTSPSPAGSAP